MAFQGLCSAFWGCRVFNYGRGLRVWKTLGFGAVQSPSKTRLASRKPCRAYLVFFRFLSWYYFPKTYPKPETLNPKSKLDFGGGLGSAAAGVLSTRARRSVRGDQGRRWL